MYQAIISFANTLALLQAIKEATTNGIDVRTKEGSAYVYHRYIFWTARLDQELRALGTTNTKTVTPRAGLRRATQRGNRSPRSKSAA